MRFVDGLASAVRVTLRVLAAVLVLAALLVSVGRLLLPLVAEYRLDVEQRLAAALDRPVSVGELTGDWHGLSPGLEARDVVIGSGGNPLRLDRLRLRVDPLVNPFRGAWPAVDIEVSGLQLSAAEDVDGQWSVQGISRQEPGAPFDPRPLLESLAHLGRLSFSDAQLTLLPRSQPALSLDYIDLTLSNQHGRQRLDGRLLLPDGQPLRLTLQGRLDAREWRDSELQGYASLPQSDWASIIPAAWTHAWHLERLEAGGEVWLGWREGRVQRAALRLRAPSLRVSHADQPAVEAGDLSVDAFLQNSDGYQVQIDSLAMSLEGERWRIPHLQARQTLSNAEPEAWQIQADKVPLQPLGLMAARLLPLPARAQEAADALRPSGTLQNVAMIYRPGAPLARRLSFSASFDRVAAGAYRGSPAFANASGRLHGDLGGGEARVDSDDFMLHLDRVFPQPWRYHHAAGRLHWTLDDEAFTLVGSDIRAEGDEGRAVADFAIHLARDPEADSYMDLRAGLRDGDAHYTEKYLPTRLDGMNPALADWLKEAIRAGRVDEGYFQYQGSLKKGSGEHSRALSLYARAHDVELAYQPGWPVLKDASAELMVENTHVRVRGGRGRILQSDVRDVEAEVQVSEGVPRLRLKGAVTGRAADGLALLKDTPLPTASVFRGWSASGPVEGQLELDIPLRKGLPPDVRVAFDTRGSTLHIARPDLTLTDVTGAFRFDSASGLSGNDVSATLFERPVRGQLTAVGKPGAVATQVDATGDIAVADVMALLKFDRPIPASGVATVRFGLTVGAGEPVLTASSTLQGVAVDLPAPLGKAPETAVPSSLRVTLGEPERQYAFTYGERLSLAASLPGNDLSAGRGEILLGGPKAQSPASPGYRIAGHVGETDAQAWRDAYRRYLPQATSESATGPADGPLPPLTGSRVDLHVDRLTGLGAGIERLALGLRHQPQGWVLEVDSSLVTGRAIKPDDPRQPTVLELAALHLPPRREAIPPSEEARMPATTAEPAARDPLASVDPRDLPALNVGIAQVFMGDTLLGPWSLKARPLPDGAQFSEVSLGLNGMTLAGDLNWQVAPGGPRSTFRGQVKGDRLQDVLVAWGFAPTATSEHFRLEMDGYWPGSPAAVSPRRYTGSLDARLESGAFVEVDGAASALRVFGLLNFESIGRRLRLDFSDLLGRGLSYDQVTGRLQGNDGVFNTLDPIRLEGPSSNLQLDGMLDMANNRIDANLQVSLPLTNNLPLAALIVGAPAVGGALFIVDRLLGDRVSRMASVRYHVEGPWQSPRFTLDKPF